MNDKNCKDMIKEKEMKGGHIKTERILEIEMNGKN